MQVLTARRRVDELMDDPGVDREELAQALAFIRRVNRRLGGVSAALGHLDRWSAQWQRDGEIRILDVGTGSADIPLAIARWARRRGHRVHITGVDLHETTIELARRHVAGEQAVELICADALGLMDRFEPGSFDYVHAGMFIHHLDDIPAVTALRIMDRLAARGVIWNDLVRGWIGRAGVRLLTIGATPIVRHDALVSFDAGFTRAEAMDLALRAGLCEPRYRRHLGYRFTLVTEKVP